jgi:tetratricopeptide (TPR) repeat protein
MRREHRTNYIAACLTTLTRVYIQQNEFALAQRCVDESLALTEDPSYAVLRAQALGDGARIMLATNKPQEALRTYALALQTYERAFELRFVIRTLLGTLDALLDLGFAKRAAQISGYILGACAATGSVANAAIFEASSTYQRTREQAGDEFDGCARLGATFTYADVVKDVCDAASREDDFRTIASL